MEIPEAPIKLSGFPTCKAGDGREVESRGDFCAQDGGKSASPQILRRAIHRQVRCGIAQMQRCEECKGIPLADSRCKVCSWWRGGVMGIAGLAEQMGYAEEMIPYMEMISVYAPGWQDRVSL